MIWMLRKSRAALITALMITKVLNSLYCEFEGCGFSIIAQFYAISALRRYGHFFYDLL